MKYLTIVFDDGPSRLMCEMADKIAAYGWHAAFAIIGRKINEETLPMLRYVIDNGFQLVSHGQEHAHMDALPSREAIIEEFIRPIQTVEEKLGYHITMARTPFLTTNEEILSVAKELNLPLLGWGMNDGRDWHHETASETVERSILGSLRDGAIGGLHVMDHTAKALDTILPGMKEAGYAILTPEELFAIKGITPPPGVQVNNVNDCKG